MEYLERKVMTNKCWDEMSEEAISDQKKGVLKPEILKKYHSKEIIKLPDPKPEILNDKDLIQIIWDRRSVRVYKDKPVSLEKLAFILWAGQRVKMILNEGLSSLRTVPSAGGRHPFESYAIIRNVEGLEMGIYHYLANEHKLELIKGGDFKDEVTSANLGQVFVGTAPFTYVLTAIPYRTELRYRKYSTKLVLLDAGHVLQNIYIACEGGGLGICAIDAFSDKQMNEVMDIDGEEEFVVYLAPVGIPKIKIQRKL